jgi:hypothetical protein
MPEGLTLKDWFAGMALQGLLANRGPGAFEVPSQIENVPLWSMDVAVAAYGLANSMLAQKECEEEEHL